MRILKRKRSDVVDRGMIRDVTPSPATPLLTSELRMHWEAAVSRGYWAGAGRLLLDFEVARWLALSIAATSSAFVIRERPVTSRRRATSSRWAFVA